MSIQGLSNEILIQLINHLHRLDALCLRGTCRKFHTFIGGLAPGEALDLETEMNDSCIQPLACSKCNLLRRFGRFTIRNRRGKRGRGGHQAAERFCLDCGLKCDENGHRIYSRGTILNCSWETYIVCIQCENLGLHDDQHYNLCPDCWSIQEYGPKYLRKPDSESESGMPHGTVPVDGKEMAIAIHNKILSAEALSNQNKSLHAEAKAYNASVKRKRHAEELKIKAKVQKVEAQKKGQ